MSTDQAAGQCPVERPLGAATEQALYSLIATADDEADDGNRDRAKLLRACAATLGAEIERLRQALRDIADPIAAWQRDLRPGYTLDGGMCVHMANDPEAYKRMAREALRA